MNFLLSGILAASLSLTPVVDESTFKNVPESVLVDGLNNIAVCMITDAVAITTLSRISKDAHDKDEGQRMKADAQDLMGALVGESEIGDVVMDALVEHYNHTFEQVGTDIEEVSEAARKELTDLAKNVDDYTGFTEIFKGRISSCEDTLRAWVKKVQSYSTKPEKKS